MDKMLESSAINATLRNLPSDFSESGGSEAIREKPDHGLSARQMLLVLSCLIAHGFGIEAICFFLSIGQKKLQDLVVDLEVSMPHDRPMRKRPLKSGWSSLEHLTLIKGWVNNYRAGYIATQIKRTKASIQAQAGRLGLPKRDRKFLHTPAAIIAPEASGALSIKANTSGNVEGDARQTRWRVKNCSYLVVVELNVARNSIIWTPEMFELMFRRRLAEQDYKEMADDFGISPIAMRSKLSAIGVPPVGTFASLNLTIAKAETKNIEEFSYRIHKRSLGTPGRVHVQNTKTMNMSREDKRIMAKQQSMFC
jgi:hypothetical protein